MATATQSGEHLFRRAMDAWESALESGVKLQEESTRWLRETLCNSHTLSEWQHKAQTGTAEAIAKARESLDEGVRVMNQQAEASVRLVQKALDAPRNGSPADAPAKVAEWWQMAAESLCANTEAVLKANSSMLTAWLELLRKLSDEAGESLSHWAQTSAEQVERMVASAAANAKDMARQPAGL